MRRSWLGLAHVTNHENDKEPTACFRSLLSALCYWSPVLQSVPWLPPLAFSFFSVFGQGSTGQFACFELVVNVLGVSSRCGSLVLVALAFYKVGITKPPTLCH
jgi:hypothetical protein